jgi:hypothetical protein
LNRRSSGTVKQTKLNAGSVDHSAHDAAESVYLSDNMAFSDSPDGWIARHLSDQVEIDRHQGRFCTKARRR